MKKRMRNWLIRMISDKVSDSFIRDFIGTYVYRKGRSCMQMKHGQLIYKHELHTKGFSEAGNKCCLTIQRHDLVAEN